MIHSTTNLKAANYTDVTANMFMGSCKDKHGMHFSTARPSSEGCEKQATQTEVASSLSSNPLYLRNKIGLSCLANKGRKCAITLPSDNKPGKMVRDIPLYRVGCFTTNV